MVEWFDGRKRTLVTLFMRAANQMVSELVARMNAAGYAEIRPVHSRVFENLDPGGTRLTDLAKRAQMTVQSMSELVAGLEELGYLERRPDPADRRARLVSLTPLGREMMRVALSEIAAIEKAWLGWLDRGSGRDLRSALEEAVRSEESRRSSSTPSRRASLPAHGPASVTKS